MGAINIGITGHLRKGDIPETHGVDNVGSRGPIGLAPENPCYLLHIGFHLGGPVESCQAVIAWILCYVIKEGLVKGPLFAIEGYLDLFPVVSENVGKVERDRAHSQADAEIASHQFIVEL